MHNNYYYYIIIIILFLAACLTRDSKSGNSPNIDYSIKEFDISNIEIPQEIKIKLMNTDETTYYWKDANTIWARVIVGKMRQFYEISFENKTVTPTVFGDFGMAIFLENEIAMVYTEGVEIFDKSYKDSIRIETGLENVVEIYETQEGQKKFILLSTSNRLYIKGEEKDIIISESFNQYLGARKYKDYLFFTEIIGTSVPYKIYDLKNERLLQAKELEQAFSSDLRVSSNWVQGEDYFFLDPVTKKIQNITTHFNFIKKKHKRYETSIATTELMPTEGIGTAYINQGESVIYYNNLEKSILTKPILLEVLDSHIVVFEKLENNAGFKILTF